MDHEKDLKFSTLIQTVYWQYRAFLKTIDSYKDDSALVSKLSSQFVNGTYDRSETRGIHQVVLLAIKNIDQPLGTLSKHQVQKQLSSIAFYLKTLDVKNKEFEIAVSPFKILYKYCKRKGLKTKDIDYILKLEWYNV